MWRVVERSDLLVQIVDSRNPLLFHCPDVDVYVKEVHPCKQTVLIVNKADLIPEYARVQWGRYFDSINLPFVFFSAKASSQVIDQELERKEKEEQAKRGEEANNDNSEEKEEKEKEDKEEEEEEKEDKKPVWRSRNAFAGLDFDDSSEEEEEETEEEETEEEEKEEDSAEPSSQPSAEPSIASDIRNYLTEDILEPSAEPTTQPSIEPTTEPSTEPSAPDLFSQEDASELASLHCTAEEQRRYRIHSRGEVLAFLEAKTQAAFAAVQAYDRAHPSSTASRDFADRRAVVGMLGFPNVGKSSLINVLLGVSATSHGAVRVAVGATPGKTKHPVASTLSSNCPRGVSFPFNMSAMQSPSMTIEPLNALPSFTIVAFFISDFMTCVCAAAWLQVRQSPVVEATESLPASPGAASWLGVGTSPGWVLMSPGMAVPFIMAWFCCALR